MTATDVAAKNHAVLGPSGWDRWSICPGSVPLSEGRENRVSVYAAEGTVAHEIGAYCLQNNADAGSFVGQVFRADGYEFTVDDDMATFVNQYCDVVRSLIDPERGDVLMVEQEVPIGHLTGEKGATGTSDVIGIVADGTRLVVVDFKYGRGVTVSAQGNGQMRMYALGALEKLGAVYDEIAEVEMVICQPRAIDEPDTDLIALDELLDFAHDVKQAAGRIELATTFHAVNGFNGDEHGHFFHNDFLTPDEKACKFCNARAICPALRAEVEGSMQLVSAAEPIEFEDLTLPKKASSLLPAQQIDDEKLAEAFRAIDLIEGWIKAVEEEVHARLMNRHDIPGLYLGEGKRPPRAWGDAAVAEAELKKRYKVDEMYDKKLISPTKAERLMKDKPRIWAKVVETAGIVQAEAGPKVCRVGIDKNRPYALPSPDDFDDLTVGDVVLLEEAAASFSEPVSSSLLDD